MSVTKIVVDFEAVHKLPPLQGTPRQVAFGRDMRYRYLRQSYTLANTLTVDARARLKQWIRSFCLTGASRFWIGKQGTDLASDFANRNKKPSKAKRRRAKREYVPPQLYKTNVVYAPPKAIPKPTNWKLEMSKRVTQPGWTG